MEILLSEEWVYLIEKGVSVISIIVDGSNDEIGALTGKLGNINGIRAKVALTY